MSHPGRGLRLTAFVNEGDLWHRRPVYQEIVRRAKGAGLSGATVVRAIEGFGASGVVHTTRILSLCDQLPLIVIIVDSEELVREFLPQLKDVMSGGTVFLDEVELVR
jgi:uncharacterized protein